jgi:hypothetical protein
MDTLGDKNEQKVSSLFNCISCHYKCSRKYNWERHILSAKHIKKSKNEKEQNTCEHCNKSYKSRNGLWRHKKNCIKEDNVNNEKDLMLIIIKDNIELKKIILEQQQLLLEIVNKPL